MKFQLAVAATVAAFAQATTPDNVSSRLMVHIPRELYREGGYDHREALFGVPPYGGSISQNVYYANGDLCDAFVDATKWSPKLDDTTDWSGTYILMVDRGGCTFVQKVRNAQRAGAAGVIIADNVCLCSDPLCQNDGENCEESEPIMADDGSGSDITIPSFLMFKRDADKIKGQLQNNQPVQIEMKWSLPNPDDHVDYSLWTVPTDAVSRSFLQNWKPFAKALGDKASFTPHMYIYDGIKTNCRGTDQHNHCYSLCTNDGLYCATDPDNDLDHGISGADVVKESLRRLCIWEHYGRDKGAGEIWFDYVSKFMERCSDADYFKNEDCVKDAYKHAGIDASVVNQCMTDSGGLETSEGNTFLSAEIGAQTENGVVVLPTAFVNNAAIRGQLSVKTVFEAICAGFSDGTAPTICDQCARCGDPAACVENGGMCTSVPAGTVSTHTFASSMLMVIALFSAAGYWHYQKTREDMRDQVRGILADYMPLEEQEGGDPSYSPMNFAMQGGKQSLIS